MLLQAYEYFNLLDLLYVEHVQVWDFFFLIESFYIIDFFDVNLEIWQTIQPFNKHLKSTIGKSSLIDFYSSKLISNDLILNKFLIEETTPQLNILQNIYHYSVPTVKLFYPEPFIAAASFMHTDLWFVHILVYQYWLWFVFIFIIVFFIITFLCIVRWCNMRVKPRRETRGVSRSKCGDLITAIVPVSWAASIIISESTDAIDYFDGFGTTEMVIGIRAYQWGWEYYYPKDIDLNYNVKKSYSSFFGRSLKYSRTGETNLSSNKAWKFYQNKPYDFVITPAHLLLIPTDNHKVLNYLNFSDVGTNSFHESSLFKHTRMFSKTWNSNLLFSMIDFNLKFKNISPLFISEFEFYDSAFYGLKRQQNLFNTKGITNNFSTFFDLSSVKKLFNHNYYLDFEINKTFHGNYQIFFFKTNTPKIWPMSWLMNQSQSNLNFDSVRFSFTKKFIFSTILEKLNSDNDKKKLKNSLKKIYSNHPKKINLLNKIDFDSISSFNNNISSTLPFTNFFNNIGQTKKLFVSFSINQFVQKPGQTPKQTANVVPRKGNFNLSSYLNASSFYQEKSSTNLNFSFPIIKTALNSKSVDPQLLIKLLTNRTYFDAPTPIWLSNKKENSLLNFDKYIPAEEENSFAMFQAREDISPEFIYKAYWNNLGAHTDLSWRLKNSFNFSKIHNAFYLPFFTFGQDYDFLNWQGFTYLEDAYWENLVSVYAIDDYFNFFDSYEDYSLFDKPERRFLRKNRRKAPEDHSFTEPYLYDLNCVVPSYSSFIYNEETIVNSNLLATLYYSLFASANNNILIEESFDYHKYLSQFYYNSSSFYLNTLASFFIPNSNIYAMNIFRSNTEDIVWFNNDKLDSFFSKTIDLNILSHIKLEPKHWNFCDFFFNNSFSLPNHLKHTVSFSTALFSWLHHIDTTNFQKTLRLLNKFELRAPTRSAIGIYNSYQKVYKPRLDENRSHAKTIDVANLTSKQPNLTAPKPKLERSLGKNKTLYFQTSFFKNSLPINFNFLYDSFNSLNYYFFDYPFLMSLKSDASRYYWTDWFSRWGMFEVQPASSSRYTLAGAPFFNKSFDFTSEINAQLYDFENYFSRLARARKNFLSNWAHTPYFYAKNTFFMTNNFFFEAYKLPKKKLLAVKEFLDLSSWYWNVISFEDPNTTLFFLSHSNIHSYARANWVFNSSISSYYSTVSSIIDILTKREFFYREYLKSKRKIYRIENFMTNNPHNPLINDLKSVFLLANPVDFNIEYSRDLYYSSLEFFNSNYVKPNMLSFFCMLGFPLDLLNFFINTSKSPKINNSYLNNEPIKSQYRPMRRGILNMIRLHGTGAVAMPIEIRLQVLASSKDVIHSWAIPSAGVKIDCVPGYSSHRVIIFLVSGIFWGQCMEICGRYHHWMPIIVYFMKRDLFFLWCTHFVFLSGSNNMFVINDRQNTNYNRTVSFSKNTWINELT